MDTNLINNMKERHTTEGEELMAFWTAFMKPDSLPDDEKDEDYEERWKMCAHFCLKKVLELDPNDRVFSERPGGRAEILQLYFATCKHQKAEVELRKAQAEHDKHIMFDKHDRYINKDLFKNESKERVIADFIAGMTDRYAINLHKKIK